MAVTVGQYDPDNVLGAAAWTVVTASADTRIVYLDSAAADDTGDGLSAAHAKKTAAAAKALLRDGFPDWLLIKCGSVFSTPINQIKVGGRSATEPLLISSYGTGARPVMNAGGNRSLFTTTGGGDTTALGGRYTAVIGIEFYDTARDPDSPDYNASATALAGIALFNTLNWFLIEDCTFRFCDINIQTTAFGGEFRFRRNIIVDNYAVSPARAQGIFLVHPQTMVMEENFFDHNGWNETVVGAGATIFNHNVYISSLTGACQVRGNISARASSHGMQVRSGGTIYDNLIVSCAIGIVGGNPPNATADGTTGGPDGANTYATYNVIIEGTDIGVNARAWGIDFSSGDPTGATQVANVGFPFAHYNIIAHKDSFDVSGHGLVIGSLTTGATDTNNIIFDWDDPIRDNGTGNTTTPNQIDANGDNVEYSFPDPNRDLASYDLSIGGPGTAAHFYSVCRARGRGEWDGRYTARAVNDYIRAGFSMQRLASSFRVTLTAKA